jgi:Protein of unknown function (DUF2628)
VSTDGGSGSPNPYAAPQTEPAAAPPGPGDAPTREELQAFAGENAPYYWERSARRGHNGGLLAGWNWAAAFLSMLWMLHRRMWKEFSIVVGVMVVWGVIEGVAEAMLDVGAETSRGIERLGNAVFGLVMGMIGNGLYLRRARRVVLESRRLLGSDPQAQLAHLAKRGGTSWIAPLIAVAIGAVLAILVVMAADA